MRYPIGAVARSLGVTTAGLHYFEKEGVIAPVKGDQSHRTYSIEDFIRLVSFRKYRNMEMPVRDIAKQFSPEGLDYSQILSRIAAQREYALQTAKRYEQLAEDIAWFEEHISVGMNRIGAFDFVTLPYYLALVVGSSGCISLDREEQEETSVWLEQLPALWPSVFCSSDGLSQFGYAVAMTRLPSLPNLATAHTHEGGGKTCVHTFVKVPRSFFEDPAMAFVSAQTYLQEHGFHQNGEGVGIVLCVHCHGEELDSLVEIFLPFS